MTPWEFWHRPVSDFQRTTELGFVHPDDAGDVDALFSYHRPYLHTFPAPFWGALRTAPLILAYAGPGHTEEGETNDVTQGVNRKWLNDRCASFDGLQSVDNELFHWRVRNWFTSRAEKILGKQGAYDSHREKVAFINLAAYRGRETKWEEVAFLRSTQVMREWARLELFPSACRGERVVLIMRAHRWWGVRPGSWRNGSLFAPNVTRHGYVRNVDEVDREALSAARAAVGL